MILPSRSGSVIMHWRKILGLLCSVWNSPETGGPAGMMVPPAGVEEAAGASLLLCHVAVCAEVL